MAVIVVRQGCSRTVPRIWSFGVGPSGVNSGHRVSNFDNCRSYDVLRTPIPSMKYLGELHSILRGAMVL